jgi:hypothetical protein
MFRASLFEFPPLLLWEHLIPSQRSRLLSSGRNPIEKVAFELFQMWFGNWESMYRMRY